MFKERNNLLIAASGTGGHIFPALAVSKMIDKNWNINWLGVKQRIDSELIPRKYNLLTLNLKSPQRNFFVGLHYFKILFSTFRIIKILKEKKINLVFTTGGYISAPTIIAAKLLKIPVIIHESNLIPGTVTKYFGFLCEFVLIGFKETNNYLKSCKTIFTGTPLRDEFYQTNSLPEWVPKGKGPLLIIIGGSQGAKAINDIFYESLDFLKNQNFRVVHIIGKHNFSNAKTKKYNNYVQKKFTNQIASLMQNCDLVISRSGSGTINELIQTRKPSILIPYPNSKNNHQEKNAMILSSIGGSILINQRNISVETFQKTLKRIFKIKLKEGKSKYEILELMKENMKNLNSFKSSKKIKKLINYFLNEL